MQDLSVAYSEKKHSYDSVAAGLASTMAKLGQEVKGLNDELVKSESQFHLLTAEKEILSFKHQQASDEIKLYLSNDPQDKKKSLREQLVTNLAEQERLGRLLREDQKAVEDLVQTSAKQLGMWRDVVKLLEVKQKCLEAARSGAGVVTRSSGGEALVLT